MSRIASNGQMQTNFLPVGSRHAGREKQGCKTSYSFYKDFSLGCMKCNPRLSMFKYEQSCYNSPFENFIDIAQLNLLTN